MKIRKVFNCKDLRNLQKSKHFALNGSAVGFDGSDIITLRLVQQGFRGGKTPRKALIY